MMQKVCLIICLVTFIAQATTLSINACEDDPLIINCEDNNVIKIITANYGRSSISICAHRGNLHNLACYSDKSLAILKTSCDDKQSCVIIASNSNFGDTCEGTVKYLDVQYQCQPRPPATCPSSCKSNESSMKPYIKELTCDRNSPMRLECSEGELIHIIRANYGRTSTTPCRKAGNEINTNCVSHNSIWIVAEKCDFRRACEIDVNKHVFGDPCPNTDKYLEVHYKCFPDLPQIDVRFKVDKPAAV